MVGCITKTHMEILRGILSLPVISPRFFPVREAIYPAFVPVIGNNWARADYSKAKGKNAF
jgi:hypothetical protein